MICIAATLMSIAFLFNRNDNRSDAFEIREVWRFEVDDRSIDALEIAIAPDASKFAIYERQTEELRVFKGADQKLLWQKQISKQVVSKLVFSNTAKTLCIFDETQAILIDTEDGEVIAEHEFSCSLHDPTYEKVLDSPTEVFFSAKPARLVKVDFETGEETDVFALEDFEDKFPEITKWLPDVPIGKLHHFEVTNGQMFGFQGGYLFRFDVEKQSFSWLTHFGEMPSCQGPLYVTPGNTLSGFLSGDMRPVRFDSRTGEVTAKLSLPNSQLLETPESEHYFLLNKTGKGRPTEFYILDSKGAALLSKKVLWKADSDGRLSISSDGKFILTALSAEGTCVLWKIIDVNGG
ncbi:PQQ-binding-like beta-propeller repeat protein [bacterium]|nr:PQQ-binding-like beta-propeller repeat protein [bacterium]